MGRLEIVEKLDSLLSNKIPFKDECEVAYLMVEIRKILDREKSSERKVQDPYQLLRFYCDWVVHTEKDGITPEIEQIMIKIYNELLEHESKGFLSYGKISSNTDFVYMGELKLQMELFFKEMGLNLKLVRNENWTPFVALLVGVLVDQPINFVKYNKRNEKKGILPLHNIKSFAFETSNPNAAIWRITFLDESTQAFGNVF